MRMKELEARSGVPRSTIYYYLAEGLLPAPERQTRNSAQYSREHVDRLRLIRRLRATADLPMVSVRRVLALIEQGVEAEVAVALHRAVHGGASGAADAENYSFEELAAAAGVSAERLRALVDVGALIPLPGSDRPFDATDLEMARIMVQAVDQMSLDLQEIGAIAQLLRTVSAREMALRNRISKGLDADTAARISGRLQEWANAWHAYVFARARLHDIAEHGLGIDPDSDTEEVST